MFREITIIGGAGHVGLAFALICAKKNIKVHILMRMKFIVPITYINKIHYN